MKYSQIELALPQECVTDCGEGGGSKDAAVAHWMAQPEIAQQFENLTLVESARILYGYGSWNVEELKDLETNKQRILWLAASDAAEAEHPDVVDGTHFVTMEGHGYDAELAELEN